MHDFALWVESTRISKTLFDITWLWPLCESLHFIGLCMLIGAPDSSTCGCSVCSGDFLFVT